MLLGLFFSKAPDFMPANTSGTMSRSMIAENLRGRKPDSMLNKLFSY